MALVRHIPGSARHCLIWKAQKGNVAPLPVPFLGMTGDPRVIFIPCPAAHGTTQLRVLPCEAADGLSARNSRFEPDTVASIALKPYLPRLLCNSMQAIAG